MNKLSKTAKTLDAFFKITYRLTIAANVFGILCILLFLYLCLGAPSLFKTMTGALVTKLDFGAIVFQVAESYPPNDGIGAAYFIGSLIIGTVGFLIYALMIRNIRSILTPMKEGLPFSQEVAHGFKNLGWLIIVNGILTLVGDFLLHGSIIRAYDMKELFLTDKIETVTTYYNFDFTFLITALILFGLSYIFRYGAELQQLSDETL